LEKYRKSFQYKICAFLQKVPQGGNILGNLKKKQKEKKQTLKPFDGAVLGFE